MTVKKTNVAEVKYTKEQLLSSAVFRNRKDALQVVIQDGEKVTVAEAKTRLKNFMKGKVN